MVSDGDQDESASSSYLVDGHPPLEKLDGKGIGGLLADERGEVRSDVGSLPLGLGEGALAGELGDGVGDGGDVDVDELVGLLARLLLDETLDLDDGVLLVDESLGEVVDGGNGGSLLGGSDGLLGGLGESTDLGEGGGLDDALNTVLDGGGVEGGEVGRADELEQVGDEDDLER